MIKLIPIQDRTQIISNWHFFAPGFREILEHSDGGASEASIMNKVYEGTIFMQVIFNNDRYAGFVTGYIEAVIGAKKFLCVNHLYIKEGQPQEVFWEVSKEMEKFAKEYKCDSLKFFTMRDKPFERKLSDDGWKKGYVTFYKDIGGDNGGKL